MGYTQNMNRKKYEEKYRFIYHEFNMYFFTPEEMKRGRARARYYKEKYG